MNRVPTKIIRLMLSALVIAIFTTAMAYATEPTQAELDAYNAAYDLYTHSHAEPPEGTTYEEQKQLAITAFNDFITAYPTSERAASAQHLIAQCYYDMKDFTNSKLEFNKVIDNYATSPLVDDALYLSSFSDYLAGDNEAALIGFEGLITDYEGDADEKLTHKVPFAYFMAGECYRKLDDMVSARAKWNELIVKYPTHSQAGRAQKRLNN
ncbi:tol-pal system YbgF family protein [Thermodesulfobacteriota bacterium]